MISRASLTGSPSLLRYSLIIPGLLLLIRTNGQSITNGTFENGITGWSECTVEIGTATTYGGTGTGNVAEVDGNFSTASSDDRVLCQTISGFTVGSVYRIDFDATRRANASTPPTVTVTMTMDDALNQTITRTGGYSMVHGSFGFTASLTTHVFRVTPNFEGSFGMIFDNIALSLVSSLPIELRYFNAVAQDGHVALSWATASEMNNDHFTVQRSSDGITFEDLHRISGAGNSLTEIAYTDIDPLPLPGLSYYRLQQTDLDGTTTASEISAVQYQTHWEMDIALYPNPAAHDASIWLVYPDPGQGEGALVTITDVFGQEVGALRISRDRPHAPIDLRAIASVIPGIYWVTLRTSERTGTTRLLVEGN